MDEMTLAALLGLAGGCILGLAARLGYGAVWKLWFRLSCAPWWR